MVTSGTSRSPIGISETVKYYAEILQSLTDVRALSGCDSVPVIWY